MINYENLYYYFFLPVRYTTWLKGTTTNVQKKVSWLFTTPYYWKELTLKQFLHGIDRTRISQTTDSPPCFRVRGETEKSPQSESSRLLVGILYGHYFHQRFLLLLPRLKKSGCWWSVVTEQSDFSISMLL